MDKEIFLEAYQNDLMWMILGSAISSDTNLTNEDRENNIKRLNEIKDLCSETEIIEKIKAKDLLKIQELAERGIKILSSEITYNNK